MQTLSRDVSLRHKVGKRVGGRTQGLHEGYRGLGAIENFFFHRHARIFVVIRSSDNCWEVSYSSIHVKIFIQLLFPTNTFEMSSMNKEQNNTRDKNGNTKLFERKRN